MSDSIIRPVTGPAKAGCAETGEISAARGQVDWREQLYNRREVGPAAEVATAYLLIVTLHGIVVDFDPELIADSVAPPEVKCDPQKFYESVVAPWLDRHAVFRGAEVRCSGRGLHAIVWLDRPVEFRTELDRERWAAVVTVIQRLLPADPNCPGLTALTRPLGSVNGKNGAEVVRLKEAAPVSAQAVLALCDGAAQAPFRLVAELLYGERERLSPCPLCLGEGKGMAVGNERGFCYECGPVKIGRLLDSFPQAKQNGRGAA